MRRALVVLLTVGLVAGSLAAPVEAKKKKKKKPKTVEATPVDLTFFMRRAACGTSDDNTHLSLTDAEDTDCGSSDSSLADVYATTGLVDPAEYYPTADGVPLVLDGSKPIKGVITTRSWNGAGAGNAILDLTLMGTTGGEEVELGTWSKTYTATPTAAYTHEYEFEPAKDYDGKTFTSLTLVVFTHGQTAGIHGMIEHDTPPATITIPALKKP